MQDCFVPMAPPMLSRTVIPLEGLPQALPNTAAVLVHRTEAVLRDRVSLFRSRTVEPSSLAVVSSDPLSFLIKVCQGKTLKLA